MAPTQQHESTDAVPPMSFWWALLSNRGQRGGAAISGILLRQAIPLVGVLFLHWSAQEFLLMAVVNFGWNWTLLGVWNMAACAPVGTRRESAALSASVWLRTILIGAVVFCVVTCGLGFPVYFMSPVAPVFDRIWWASVAMTLIGPLPDVVESIRESVSANLPDEQIEALAKQRRLLLIVGIIPIVGAYALLANFPNPITIKAVAVAYVLFSTLCELRPDLAAEFAKELPAD